MARSLRQSRGERREVGDEPNDADLVELPGELELMVVDRLAELAKSRDDERPLTCQPGGKDRSDACVCDDRAGLAHVLEQGVVAEEGNAFGSRRGELADAPCWTMNPLLPVHESRDADEEAIERLGAGSDGDEDHRIERTLPA